MWNKIENLITKSIMVIGVTILILYGLKFLGVASVGSVKLGNDLVIVTVVPMPW